MARIIQLIVVLVLCIHHISSLPISKSDTQKKSQAEIRASLITKDNFKDYLSRKEKSNFDLRLPKPFIISTDINVGSKPNTNARRGRSFQAKDGSTVVEGVRVHDDDTDQIVHRNGRFINNIFISNDAELPAEVVVSTEPKVHRQPRAYTNQWNTRQSALPEPRSGFPYPSFNYDDHYRGRTPDLPDSIAIESRQQQLVLRPDGQPLSAPPPPNELAESARDYSYHAGSTNGGRPVYYVVEEQDQLHEDRSPYSFEPADTHTSFTSAVADYTQAGTQHYDPLGAGPSAQADAGDFVIKEHTYTMCPGCPTFSIPIPIPKSTLLGTASRPPQRQPPRRSGKPSTGYVQNKPVRYQHARNQTFLEKIGDRIWNRYQEVYGPIYEKAQEMFDPILSGNFLGGEDDEEGIEEKAGGVPIYEKEDKNELEEESGGFNFLPVIVGGVAAAALGVTAYLASTPEKQYIEAKSGNSRQGKLLNHKTYEEAGQVVQLIEDADEKYGGTVGQ